MALLQDLREVKRMLDIDPADNTEDPKLLLLIGMASEWIEGWLGRSIFYKTRTEIYKGSGTTKLQLRSRPVFPSPPSPYSSIQVIFDETAFFGTAPGAFTTDGATETLVYGSDYGLYLDSEDGTYSKSGILLRINDYWFKPTVRQAGLLTPFIDDDTGSYKITYTAGFTLDTLPADFRYAVLLLILRMYYIMPIGVELSSDSYSSRHISPVNDRKHKLYALVAPILTRYRNFHF